ncbi:MAG: Ppx/GppA family phosphatase, partial [Gammaproteobacteria bacterium]|nr:Ppx/GppA family phosphatase [Gammaproteobacteria bacterium]
RLKEMVRLAAGLDGENQLQPVAMERAIECLGRFGERLREIPARGVRVVGTNTLRLARNSNEFLCLARQAIGHRIDIISGIEEARLIYLGVAHNVPLDEKQRLVIDIGGGSTEVIIGKGFNPLYLESLYTGCVGTSQQFFADGHITLERMRRCELAAMQEFEPLQTSYRQIGWDTAVGSSGTIFNIASVLQNNSNGGKGITPAGLQWLRDALVDAGNVNAIDLPGLQPERAPVFPGGVAIMSAAFEVLGIKRLEPVGGALREGILYDLLGRFGPEDARETTIRNLVARYQIDTGQAGRVEATALSLLAQVAEAWRLNKQKYTNMLRWAANLHELGLAIVHAQYHKHGAYLIQHADLPGFSLDEQTILAGLVEAHRRKFPLRVLHELPIKQSRAVRLAALLRIAVVLHRARREAQPPQLKARADGDDMQLTFPDEWLKNHPLSLADLDQESSYLRAAGIRLTIV